MKIGDNRIFSLQKKPTKQYAMVVKREGADYLSPEQQSEKSWVWDHQSVQLCEWGLAL